tara:strand:+ start:17678 stop:18733 length:1056 start_codon:yes stop_codon:yes gene_type:complete
MNYKKPFYQVPTVIYGNNSIKRVEEILPNDLENCLIVIDSILDLNIDFFKKILSPKRNVLLEYFDASKHEPHTWDIDELRDKYINKNILSIIGIGGGSTLDVAKSLSITLVSGQNSNQLQGWDLVNVKPIYKLGIPTIAGSGSEASRTAVLFDGTKKQGINSKHSMFNSIILDPTLTSTVDKDIAFYSAMDCYIHSVESITGTMITPLSMFYAKEALNICNERFLNNNMNNCMSLASYFGGVSIVNSEVGICHALSYGLSVMFNIRHGLANCLVFQHLSEFYGNYVKNFKTMLKNQNIVLDKNICMDISDSDLNTLVNITYMMEKPLINALGDNYRDILNETKIKEIYRNI